MMRPSLRTTFLMLALLLLLAVVGVWCWNGKSAKPSGFPMSFIQLESIHDGQISFEEKHGEIFVHVIDRFQDGHIYQLDHPGISNEQTLEILKAKQVELLKLSVEPGGATEGK